MKPKSSPIWNYFEDIDGVSARCTLCHKIYSRKGRTTTALKSHIKAMHVQEFAKFEKLDEAARISMETKKQQVPTFSKTVEFVAPNPPQRTPSGSNHSIAEPGNNADDSRGDVSPTHKTDAGSHKRRRHSTSMSSRYNEEDEFDVFGRNVSLQLKKLPLAYALESQELIQRVLKEQRIKAMKEEMAQIQNGPNNSYSPKEPPRSIVTRIESSPSPSEPCLVICETNDLIKLEHCDDLY